jgi:hypothetical protein
LTAEKPAPDGYVVLLEELLGQVRALVDMGDQTNGLVATAERLAERQPLLGTAPPALHLSSRLREAAGPGGLAGEVGAADTELAGYHRALRDTVGSYQTNDSEIAGRLSTEETAR